MDAVALARADLPAWVGVSAPLVAVACCTVSAATSTALAVIVSWRRPAADAHWTERARCAAPPRTVAAAAMLTWTLGAPFLCDQWRTPLSLLPWPLVRLAAAVSAMAACALVVRALERRLRRVDLGPAAWLLGSSASMTALFPLGLVFLLPAVLPGRLDATALALLALASGVIVAAASGLSLRLLRLAGWAAPASARLAAAVARASARLGTPVPAVDELPLSVAYAASLPLSGRLVFSHRTVAALDDAQLEAVCLHELEHLREPRPVSLLRVALTAALVPLLAFQPIIASLGWFAYVLVVGGVIGGLATAQKVWRLMEVAADQTAHRHEGQPGATASALAALYEENLSPAVDQRADVHPHLFDRMVAAGVEPGFPRPEPPSRLAARVGMLFVLPGFLMVFWVPMTLRVLLHPWSEESRVVALGLAGGNAGDLVDLAADREARGDRDGARRLLDAARSLGAADESADARLGLAFGYARQGDCDRAQEIGTGGPPGRGTWREKHRAEALEAALVACRAPAPGGR